MRYIPETWIIELPAEELHDIVHENKNWAFFTSEKPIFITDSFYMKINIQKVPFRKRDAVPFHKKYFYWNGTDFIVKSNMILRWLFYNQYKHDSLLNSAV